MNVFDLVQGGQLYFALPIALLAGLVSFLSPCVLPLVPGYLGYVGATSEGTAASKRRTLLGVGLFILGFSVVFTLTISLAGLVAVWLETYAGTITRIAGVMVIVLGLVFIGRFGVMQRTIKLPWAPQVGVAGAFLLGIVFGVGWTPCIGPTLASIAAVAVAGGSTPEAIALGIAYSAGLGIPFLLVALGFGWVSSSTSFIKRHIRAVNIIGGALLIVIGVLMVSGLWIRIMDWLAAGVVGGFQPAL